VKRDNEIVSELKNSLLYRMSLGSKELFHSNIWAWMMERNQCLIWDVFFKGFKPSNFHHAKISREFKNIDIFIEVDNYSFIIENKIKSVAVDSSQILKYQEKIDNFRKGIITGIIEPNFAMPDNWVFLSYKEISNRLKNYISFFNGETSIILEYCKILDDINYLLNMQLTKTKNKLSYECSNLIDIRLDDVYKKLKAQDFLSNYLRREIKNEILSDYELKTETGFNHKNATIGIFYQLKKSQFKVGVQIEGSQFRLFVSDTHNVSDSEIFNDYVKKGWFDGNYCADNRYVFNNKTKMKPSNGRYNKYKKINDYNFVYQYFDIEEKSYTFIFEYIDNYLKKAQEIIK
jgi:hypothetical protein